MYPPCGNFSEPVSVIPEQNCVLWGSTFVLCGLSFSQKAVHFYVLILPHMQAYFRYFVEWVGSMIRAMVTRAGFRVLTANSYNWLWHFLQWVCSCASNLFIVLWTSEPSMSSNPSMPQLFWSLLTYVWSQTTASMTVINTMVNTIFTHVWTQVWTAHTCAKKKTNVQGILHFYFSIIVSKLLAIDHIS